ncbi:MAG: alpha-galactosidase [Ignavibacteria bacterium]
MILKIKQVATLTVTVIFILTGCGKSENKTEISSSILTVKYDSLMHSIVIPKIEDAAELMDDYSASEKLVVGEDTLENFVLRKSILSKTDSSEILTLTGLYENGIEIEKTVRLEILNDFPGTVIKNVSYKNLGEDKLEIIGWINDDYKISPANDDPPFWSYQSGTYPDRRDWVVPVNPGFEQENYMGMNSSDYGGGTPVSDIWRKDIGFAVGHLETVPKLVSLPVSYGKKSSGVKLAVEYNYLEPVSLASLKSIGTFETFIHVHKGDHFSTLQQFSKIMSNKGLKFGTFPETCYEPIWCAWGYERNMTVDEVLGTLPKVKELGYEWAVLDDGWQNAEGDWFLNPQRFPNGDEDMKKLVDKIHSYGLKAKLWWCPLAVDQGTELIKKHSDFLLLDKNGEKQDITWWDSYYMCPAYEPVVEYHVQLVKKIMEEWGFDGLKIDGQHLNGVPPCYNPDHHHAYPEESVEKLQDFWKTVYETALKINKDAVIEICPCGTCYSFYNLPYMNQTVSSDPLSSWQVRLKGKTLKGLMGESSPYYGDHVELSDKGTDFASTVGIGGIVGTKFTWPTDRHPEKGYILTNNKEAEWKKWVDIYKEKMLSKGTYLGGLYDIGFDKPETHAIKKDSNLYYAFYAPQWNGNIELRGLENKRYKVTDYVNNIEIGEAAGPVAKLNVKFNEFLLIECIPLKMN